MTSQLLGNSCYYIFVNAQFNRCCRHDTVTTGQTRVYKAIAEYFCKISFETTMVCIGENLIPISLV